MKAYLQLFPKFGRPFHAGLHFDTNFLGRIGGHFLPEGVQVSLFLLQHQLNGVLLFAGQISNGLHLREREREKQEKCRSHSMTWRGGFKYYSPVKWLNLMAEVNAL